MSKITLITLEYPPFYGGVGNYYYNLVKLFNKEIDVFVDKKILNNNEPLPGVKYVNLLNKKGPIKWLKTVYLIKLLHAKNRNQIFWAGHILPIGSACWLANKLFKIKYFVSLHGLDWQNANMSIKKRWLANKILDSALFITVNSQSTANLLPEKFIHKTKIIYPAVCIQQVISDVSILTANKIKPQKYFLSVGRLVKRKGQKEAIIAWEKLSKSYPDFKLVIVGSGNMLSDLHQLTTNLQINDQVIFITNATNEQVAALYQNAFCFLFPVQPLTNDNEGFGIVCLEAQHYGLPVITTATGGVVEAVNESALLMKNGTVEEIIVNVTKVMNDEKLRQNLIKQSQVNVALFSWSKSFEQLSATIKMYE